MKPNNELWGVTVVTATSKFLCLPDNTFEGSDLSRQHPTSSVFSNNMVKEVTVVKATSKFPCLPDNMWMEAFVVKVTFTTVSSQDKP